MSSPSSHLPLPDDPGSVSGAPHLPAGFTDTFTSRYIDTGDVRLHAVIGGDGPPLLLVHGWPETWYAWRALMPALLGWLGRRRPGRSPRRGTRQLWCSRWSSFHGVGGSIPHRNTVE